MAPSRSFLRRFVGHPTRPGLFISGTVLSLIFGSGTAFSGPCIAQIEKLERQIAEQAPVSTSVPATTQSTDAQLHHQPTPSSVGQAEHATNKDAEAALERARNADKENDYVACTTALDEARRLSEIKK